MVNVKGTWWVTNTLNENGDTGPVWWRGYTNVPGDGGFANIYGSNGIAAYNLVKVTGKNKAFANLQFATNGNSGAVVSQHGFYVVAPAVEILVYHCIAHDIWVSGIYLGPLGVLHTCEAWNCDLSNDSNNGGLTSATAGNLVVNCFSHGNPGSSASGFRIDGAQYLTGCIAATNGHSGFYVTGDVGLAMLNCSAWGNKAHGLEFAGASGAIGDPMNLAIMNCSFVSNTLAAVTNTSANLGYYCGTFFNNGFGSGSQANGAGDIEAKLKGCLVSNSVSFASGQTPWNAPSTFDFSITSATAGAKGVGYGRYLDSFPGYGGTIAYPDIGAAQASSTNTGGAAAGTVGYAQ